MILPLRHALCACHLPNKWGGLRNGQDRSLRVVGAIHESPACHSEPIGEESRFVYFYFALLEILRFAQDDKLGVVGRDGRAGACSRRKVHEFGEFCPRRRARCELTAGASPRPTLILYFVRSKNPPTNPNFSLRFCTRIRVPNGIARKFPLATGGVSLYNKRQIIFADGRTARFLRCKESYNRCWVNMSECG